MLQDVLMYIFIIWTPHHQMFYQDLKLENVLLVKEIAPGGGAKTVAKLADFGLHVVSFMPSYHFHIHVYTTCLFILFTDSQH